MTLRNIFWIRATCCLITYRKESIDWFWKKKLSTNSNAPLVIDLIVGSLTRIKRTNHSFQLEHLNSTQWLKHSQICRHSRLCRSSSPRSRSHLSLVPNIFDLWESTISSHHWQSIVKKRRILCKWIHQRNPCVNRRTPSNGMVTLPINSLDLFVSSS